MALGGIRSTAEPPGGRPCPARYPGSHLLVSPLDGALTLGKHGHIPVRIGENLKHAEGERGAEPTSFGPQGRTDILPVFKP